MSFSETRQLCGDGHRLWQEFVLPIPSCLSGGCDGGGFAPHFPHAGSGAVPPGELHASVISSVSSPYAVVNLYMKAVYF